MKKIKITKYLITTLITSLVLSLYWVTTYASEQKISPTTKIIKHIEEYKINNDLEMSRKMNETKDNISILSKEDLLNQIKIETIKKGKETLKYLSSEEVLNYNGLIEQSQSKEEIDNIFNKFVELNNQKAEHQKDKEAKKKSAVETKKETISNYRSSVVLSNGNTPGEIGTYAAIKMEEATGVSRTIWEQIIARESNGNPNAVNPSGASGLFQTIPLWGPTDTVEAQINSALRAYNEALRYFGNGLQPWGF